MNLKKLVAVLIIFLTLAVIVLALFLFRSQNKSGGSAQTNNFNTPTPASQNNQAGWSDYENSGFSISYPPGYVTSPSDASNPSSAAFSEPEFNAKIYIDVFNSSEKSEDDLINLFSKLNYSQESLKINGINGEKFVGSPEARGPYHDVVYIFQKGGKTYRLQLSYENQGRNFQLEKEFDDTVASFSIR